MNARQTVGKCLAVLAVLASVFFVFSCTGVHEEPNLETLPPLAASFNADQRAQPGTYGDFAFPPAPNMDAAARGGDERVALGSKSCIACHTLQSGSGDAHHASMHASKQNISCIDCHGGYAQIETARGRFGGITYEKLGQLGQRGNDEPAFRKTAMYEKAMLAAHVDYNPDNRGIWQSSANPEAPGAAVQYESADYIRFVNPGDLHAAAASCGACHNQANDPIVDHVHGSMMSHGAMLWGAALYNNGTHNRKDPVYGEAYVYTGETQGRTEHGHRSGKPAFTPAKIIAASQPSGLPTKEETLKRGWLPVLFPLPRFEASQPGNILRVFERGGERPLNLGGLNLGTPDINDPPGRPDVKLSTRGFGTNLRTDPVLLGLQKTRLLDPTLRQFGTNDHPGDYRGSGCSACHVAYANDRSPIHSGEYAKYGNKGQSFSEDLTVNPPAARGLAPVTQPYANPWTDQDDRPSGHPIKHVFAEKNRISTSTCIVCHMHPGTNVVNSYLGFTWWDNETDGKVMYPARQQYPTGDDEYETSKHNPEGAASRGLWSNRHAGKTDHAGNVAPKDFLGQTGSPEFNAKLKHSQFADFHGHGWVFRAVYKQDRHGNFLNPSGEKVENVTADKLRKSIDHASAKGEAGPADAPVHLKDIHLEMGMSCVDCHFKTDVHGDGKIYGETRNAVMEECIDCHGTSSEPAVAQQILTLQSERDQRKRRANQTKVDELLDRAFTGNTFRNVSKPEKQRLLGKYFALKGGKLVQKSALTPNLTWEVKQTSTDGVTRANWNDSKTERDRQSVWAHSVRRDGKTWGTIPGADELKKQSPQMQLAHSESNISCYACHTSWNTSCFGCHLPMKANKRKESLHNEGQITRNYTNYNFQTLRDDVYMLGKDGTVPSGGGGADGTHRQTVPVRSACAVLVGSQDANRNWLYEQQQTISAEGFSGQAFSPYYPHTTRRIESKQCVDCHVSDANDNNAIMAQLLMLGTKSVNFVGRYSWVAAGKGGLEAVVVTERDEPQAVIGSRLHELAYPDYFKAHEAGGGVLKEAYDHHTYNILDVQHRGEYLYAAAGEDGFIAFDIANIGNKAFSERIVTAPVSPLGQKLFVKTRYATSVCSPSTMALDPTRPKLPENQEQSVALLYGFIYVTDKYEGLVVVGNRPGNKNGVGVSTLLDGDPQNNFIDKALSFNPGGALDGARWMRLHGNLAYVCTDTGIRVVDLTNPLEPRLLGTPGLSGLKNARKIAFQFRYGFVVDDEGLKVIDVTFPENPQLVTSASLAIADARDVYISRTYAYVAAGREGVKIVDVERPTEPKVVKTFSEGLVDSHAVRVAMTNASIYAYVADGVGGLKVLQLTSSDERDGASTFLGFSPMPNPRLIASYPTKGPALSLSEGLDRDRAVDEAGQQLSVFGRRGSRPFNLTEMRRMYLRTEGDKQQLYTVSNVPKTEPLEPEKPAAATQPAAPAAPARPARPGRPR
ncbi:MAG TPA: hypothetical protein VF624_06555 [Tepidisphaeraceae bacterium]|jgi:hypothetical protein